MDGMKTYFENPTQVRYFDFITYQVGDKPAYIAGIAYKDEIICSCCGEVFSIPEICEIAQKMGFKGKVIIPYYSWVNLNDEITGDVTYEEEDMSEADDNYNW